jgi:hypothetical protein
VEHERDAGAVEPDHILVALNNRSPRDLLDITQHAAVHRGPGRPNSTVIYDLLLGLPGRTPTQFFSFITYHPAASFHNVKDDLRFSR